MFNESLILGNLYGVVQLQKRNPLYSLKNQIPRSTDRFKTFLLNAEILEIQ